MLSAMVESNARRNAALTALLHIPHGNLHAYTERVLPVQDPALLAHLIAWNVTHGEVLDAKAALPVLALRGLTPVPAGLNRYTDDMDLAENAIGALMHLDPRTLKRALVFNDQLTKGIAMLERSAAGKRLLVQAVGRPQGVVGNVANVLERAVTDYLRAREVHPAWWTRTAVQNRRALRWLYRHTHTEPNALAKAVLFDGVYPAGSVFEVIAGLKALPPAEQGAAIAEHRIPLTVAVGAVSKLRDPDVLLAIIDRLTGNELLKNYGWLEKACAEDAALKGALAQAVERAKADKKVGSLRAAKAVESVSGAGKAVLEQVSERVIDRNLRIDGSVLVLADRSGSMSAAIAASRPIAAVLSRSATGQSWLTYFDYAPLRIEVTGKTLEEINEITRRVVAGGSTSIGCGLSWFVDEGIAPDVIVIVSDGGENSAPYFVGEYKRLVARTGVEPTVIFLYVRGGSSDVLSDSLKRAGIPFEYRSLDVFGMDYYSLPDLIQQVRTGRYALLEEIMDTPLLTIQRAIADTVRKYA